MIAILGASGYVGSAYRAYFERHKIPHVCLGRAEVDPYCEEKLRAALIGVRPTLVINCAGYVGKPNVDACEENQTECYRANVMLPQVVAKTCKSLEVPFAHISSGCIYQGRRPDGEPWKEEDAPDTSQPMSYYARTKVMGEVQAQSGGPCYIWRLRMPFSHEDGPRNYLTKLLTYEKLLQAENSLSHLHDFVWATYTCWMQALPFGIYNVVNPGSVTTEEVIACLKSRGIHQGAYQLIGPEEFKAITKVPRSSCVLSGFKLWDHGVYIRGVRDALRDACDRWIAQP